MLLSTPRAILPRGSLQEDFVRIKRGLVAVLAVAGATIVAPMAGSASAATVATYNVWQWNVAGQKIHDNSTTDGLITVAANSIRNRGADFASFNEICWDQYKAMQSNLRASGWPEDVENFSRFEETYPSGHASTCGGDSLGVALFSQKPMGTALRYTLPDDGRTEKRKMLCAPLTALPHLVFCTTHITTYDADHPEYISNQITYVRDKLEALYSAGDTTITAGDFNSQPSYNRMDGIYSSAVDTAYNGDNTGHYHELDDTDTRCIGYGEWTDASRPDEGPCGLGVKIDFAFVRENKISGSYSGDSLDISTACGGVCSDHRILIGTVTVTIS